MSVELRKIKVDSHVDFLKWSNSSTLKYGLFFNTLSIFANSLIP